MSKAVIFDMDGVLVDTEPEHRKIEHEIFKRLGITPTDEELKSNVGKGQMDTWSGYKEKYGFAEDPEEIVKSEAQMTREIYMSESLKPIEPAAELLKDCARYGFKIAVATSSEKENEDRVLKRLCLEEYIDVSVAGDMVSSTKPSPEIFLLAAKLLGTKPEDCVVIEDSKNGVLAAKAAGMKAVGYKVTESSQDLSMADIVIDSFDKISIDMLEELLRI